MLESAPRRQPFLSNEGLLNKQTTGGFDGCSNSRLTDYKSDAQPPLEQLRPCPPKEVERLSRQGKINVDIILDLLGPCSLSFSGSGSKSGSSFKMNNFWTISHYLFNKT